jgi:hypothetical protein
MPPAAASLEPALNFDPQRRAASPELRTSIRALCRFLESHEGALGLRKRRRSSQAGFSLAVEALTCNLAAVVGMLGSHRLLAVPRHSGAMWGKGRYGSPVFGQHFLDVLDLMAHPQVGLIEDASRGYRFDGGEARRSTVRPLPALLDHLPATALSWSAFRRAEDPEVLVLHGRKRAGAGRPELIDYPETQMTRRLRKEVQRINAYLRAAPVSLLPGAMTVETDDGQPVDPTRRTVRRIFNNANWDEGGRLYSAFWETMRREDRFRFLRIGTQSHPEGEPIANVDYGQLFVRLAYLKAGHPPPDGDLYNITGDGLHRGGWKQLVNALLLTNKRLGNWPEGARSVFPPGTRLQDAVAAIKARHSPVVPLFGCGVGIKLMLLESEMLIATVLALFGRGITALPLHDSVLEAASQAAAAEETMRASFTRLTGGAHASLKTTVM